MEAHVSKIVKARAWCNNEVAYLAWEADKKIDDCLGFRITRIHLDGNGKEVERRILPAWAAFKTQSNPKWNMQDTSVWPIQKFSWRDLTLRRSRDTLKVRGPNFSVKYEIVPVGLEGPGRVPVPRSPDADPSKYDGDPVRLFFCGDPVVTNAITITTDVVMSGPEPLVSAGFTNGILSTQNLRQQLNIAPGDTPTKKNLKSHIKTSNDKIREFLTADALPLIHGFMERAKKEKCDLYLALYELNDPELVQLIKDNADRVHLILSTAGSSKPAKGSGKQAKWDTTNQEKGLVKEFHDRMFNNTGHIGHNKFAVLVETASAQPKAVLAGSTNWTFTGLCTQSNNVIIINDAEAAKAYLAYWKRLRDDDQPAPTPETAPNKNVQGQELRQKNRPPTSRR